MVRRFGTAVLLLLAGIAPAAAAPRLLAVLPLCDLSDAPAPLAEIRAALTAAIEARGLATVADEPLRAFMRRHRVRDTGGVSGDVARAARAELGADGVLVTSLDLYAGTDVPKAGLTSRLVSAGDLPRIEWMDSVARSGDERPGLLGLGLVGSVEPLWRDAVDRLAASLQAALAAPAAAARGTRPASPVARRFRPRSLFWSHRPTASASGTPKVAVLPFADDSTTPHAGDLVALQIVRHLVAAGDLDVVEPGAVRDALLRSRLIQEEGLSIPQADLLHALLGVDLVLFGEVSEYVEAWAGATEPEVDFSVRAIDTRARQVIGASLSHARGDDGAFFFGAGRVATAHALADRMSRAVADEVASSMEEP